MRIRHVIVALACVVAIVGNAGISGAATNAENGFNCTGGKIKQGTYNHLTVSGICILPHAGAVHVRGGITVEAGAVLNAITPATLTVSGGITVGEGAILGLGCSPAIGCHVTTHDRVYGSVTATDAAAVILHSNAIHGDVSISGGGGGVNCDNNPITQGPLYADAEDNHIYGDLSVSGLQTCWLGIIRNHVRGDVTDTNNTMADPDANEVVTNHIFGNLACSGNTPAAQSGDSGGIPNRVAGTRSGECAAL